MLSNQKVPNPHSIWPPFRGQQRLDYHHSLREPLIKSSCLIPGTGQWTLVLRIKGESSQDPFDVKEQRLTWGYSRKEALPMRPHEENIKSVDQSPTPPALTGMRVGNPRAIRNRGLSLRSTFCSLTHPHTNGCLAFLSASPLPPSSSSLLSLAFAVSFQFLLSQNTHLAHGP